MAKGPQGKLGPSKDPEVKKLRKKQFDTYMAEKMLNLTKQKDFKKLMKVLHQK